MRGHKQIVRLLLDNGADVNAKDAKGESTLKLAKKFGQKEIAEMLEKAGAKE